MILSKKEETTETVRRSASFPDQQQTGCGRRNSATGSVKLMMISEIDCDQFVK